VSAPSPFTTYPKVALCPGLSEPFQRPATDWPVGSAQLTIQPSIGTSPELVTVTSDW
jgi:hypothetical protein